MVLKSAYYALCESHLSYGILVWGHSSIRHHLFSLQRKAIRILANINYRDDCKEQFKNLQILTLPCIYILKCLLYVKTNLHLYKQHSDYHSYFTRNKDALCPRSIRLSKSKNAAEYYSVKFFNKLPVPVQELEIVCFKKRIKNFLLGKAYNEFSEFINDDCTFYNS